jgi:hypothetical protein
MIATAVFVIPWYMMPVIILLSIALGMLFAMAGMK